MGLNLFFLSCLVFGLSIPLTHIRVVIHMAQHHHRRRRDSQRFPCGPPSPCPLSPVPASCSANVLFLASTVMVPIGNVAFSLKFVPHHQDLHWSDTMGLLFILSGEELDGFVCHVSFRWYIGLLGSSLCPVRNYVAPYASRLCLVWMVYWPVGIFVVVGRRYGAEVSCPLYLCLI